jgi:hypothetical protein
MDESEMTVAVTSTTERDDLYAEILFQNCQWAEVRLASATRSPELVIYPPLNGEPYVFSVESVRRALEEAVIRLQRVEGK